MTDVIHKVLNDITVDEWSVIIGGDSHTRMSKGVAFGADSGTVALALATGEAAMPIPESVKVTFTGEMQDGMDFRDVVHATQQQMLKKFGENVFQGRVIEVHIGTLLADQAFTFTDWTAEMKAKASICVSEPETLIQSLESGQSRIQIMINKGMENAAGMLRGLIDKADARINDIKNGTGRPVLMPDDNCQYYAELTVDLNTIVEPMIADPDVNNEDVSKRYTHDVIRPLSYYAVSAKSTSVLWAPAWCTKMTLRSSLKSCATGSQARRSHIQGSAGIGAPTYNIIDELKAEGDWEILQKYAGFEFDDNAPKQSARTEYEPILYLERPVVTFAWVTKRKQPRVTPCLLPLPVCSRVAS